MADMPEMELTLVEHTVRTASIFYPDLNFAVILCEECRRNIHIFGLIGRNHHVYSSENLCKLKFSRPSFSMLCILRLVYLKLRYAQ